MKPKIHQGALFKETAHKTPAPLPAKTYKVPPNLSLVGGLNESALKTDSVYMLRILAAQGIRSLPHEKAKKDLIQTIQAEICLKQGKLPPELILKNLFMKKGK
jgi:hypothetical protein